MEPQGRRRASPFRVTKRSTKLRRLSKTTRSRVHVQMVGLNAETKKVSAPSRRGRMSLDIPFYRTSPGERVSRACGRLPSSLRHRQRGVGTIHAVNSFGLAEGIAGRDCAVIQTG